MDTIFENSDQDQFANGQCSRDLRVDSDTMEPDTQLDVLNAIEHRPGVETSHFFVRPFFTQKA